MTDTLMNNSSEAQLKKEEKELGIEFECQGTFDNEIKCYGVECKAHIITQHFVAHRKTTQNVLKLCKAHEEYFNHLGVKAWFEYIKKYFPKHFEFMQSQYSSAEKQLKRAEYVMREYEIFNKVANQI